MKSYDKDGNEIKVDKKIEKERKAAFEAISKKAILVNMTRKQISNMPFDVQTSQDVCKWLGVKSNSMLQVRKLLFNPERLSKIRSLVNDALLMVWNHTRPWDNIGYRLLPMEYYDDFNETFGKIKDEFEESVKEFTDNYDDYVKESKGLLGKAFNKNDYPAKNQLGQYFNLEIHTNKFPDIDDIRLNLSGSELAEMQNEIAEKYEGSIQASINELISLVQKGIPGVDVNLILSTIEKMNVAGSPEVEMQLTELREKYGNNKVDDLIDIHEEETESMMVMDDVDDADGIMDDYV